MHNWGDATRRIDRFRRHGGFEEICSGREEEVETIYA